MFPLLERRVTSCHFRHVSPNVMLLLLTRSAGSRQCFSLRAAVSLLDTWLLLVTRVDRNQCAFKPNEWLSNTLCVSRQRRPVEPRWQDIFPAGTACLFRQWSVHISCFTFTINAARPRSLPSDLVLVKASSNQREAIFIAAMWLKLDCWPGTCKWPQKWFTDYRVSNHAVEE